MMKRSLFILSACAALAGSAIAATTVVDFDNQYFATAAPAVFGSFFISQIDSTASGTNLNVGKWDDPTLQTSAFPNGNIARITNPAGSGGTGPVPAGNNTNALELKFSFMGPGATTGGGRHVDGARTFLRASSAISTGTNKIFCPAIDITKPVTFDIYSVESIEVSLIVREANYTGLAVGQSPASITASSPFGVAIVGGAPAGPGALPSATRFEGGFVVPAGQWKTLTFDMSDLSKYTFVRLSGSNAFLSSASGNNLIGLEGIGISPLDADQATPKKHWVFVDNFRSGLQTLMTGKFNLGTNPLFNLAGKTMSIYIKNGGGTQVMAPTNVTLDASGNYSLPITLADGSYTAYGEGLTHCRQGVAITVSGGNATNVNFTPLNGDGVKDNTVDFFDYLLLSDKYETVDGDPGYDAAADFNKDGEINLFDYFIVSDNYEKVGDDV